MPATRQVTLIVAEYDAGLAHVEIVTPAAFAERAAQIAACADFEYGNGHAMIAVTLTVPADAEIVLEHFAQVDLDPLEERIDAIQMEGSYDG